MSIGFTLPFAASTGSVGYFQMTETEMSALEQDIRSLLMTNWGERVMHYDFGCNLREFIFEQRTQELKLRIADRINLQFSTWLPFVVVDELNIFFDDETSEIPSNGIAVVIAYRMINKPDLKGQMSYIATS